MGRGKNDYQHLFNATAISTAGGPITRSIVNPNHERCYLIIVTANETPTASLAVTITSTVALPSGDFVLDTATAITTEKTTVLLLGSLVAADEGVDEAFDLPLPRDFDITYTVSGASAAFDVSSAIVWM